MTSPLPLSVLLTHALITLTRDYDRARADDPLAPSLAVWSNVLRAIEDDGVDQRELPKLVSLSRRAVRTAIQDLVHQSWLVVESVSSVRGLKILRLTSEGRQAREAGQPLIDEVEEGWSTRLGEDRIGTLRALLVSLVEWFDIELPHHITGYGQGDVSITGGSYYPEDRGPPRVPAHGQEWPVVLRASPSTVSELPLSALLSQVLAAFTIDYDRQGLGGLGVVSNLLQFVSDEGMSLGQASAMGDVSGTGRSGLERHRVVMVEPGKRRDPNRLVHLTEKAKRQRDAYASLVAEVEQRWRSQYGERVLDDLRASLESLDNEFEEALPNYPSVSEWLQIPRERRRQKS